MDCCINTQAANRYSRVGVIHTHQCMSVCSICCTLFSGLSSVKSKCLVLNFSAKIPLRVRTSPDYAQRLCYLSGTGASRCNGVLELPLAKLPPWAHPEILLKLFIFGPMLLSKNWFDMLYFYVKFSCVGWLAATVRFVHILLLIQRSCCAASTLICCSIKKKRGWENGRTGHVRPLSGY